MKSMRRVVVLGAMVCSVLPLASQAQESTAAFPARPVTLVVPAQPGASFDITARLYAQKLGDSLRQPVVLEHKPGAGGTIAYAHVAKAAPNGYTMMLVTPTFVLTGLLYKDLAWDVQKSFAPISHTSSAPYVFYVHPALPVRNLQEYMAHAKANPGVLNMGYLWTPLATLWSSLEAVTRVPRAFAATMRSLKSAKAGMTLSVTRTSATSSICCGRAKTRPSRLCHCRMRCGMS